MPKNWCFSKSFCRWAKIFLVLGIKKSVLEKLAFGKFNLFCFLRNLIFWYLSDFRFPSTLISSAPPHLLFLLLIIISLAAWRTNLCDSWLLGVFRWIEWQSYQCKWSGNPIEVPNKPPMEIGEAWKNSLLTEVLTRFSLLRFFSHPRNDCSDHLVGF